MLEIDDVTVEGFNIWMNCGATAGQTIFHCHVHLIPRRKGDVENPRGGCTPYRPRQRGILMNRGHPAWILPE